MIPSDVFLRVARALDTAGVPYMLTGGFASAYYGALRSTLDTDILVAPSPTHVVELVRELQALNFLVDPDAAVQASREQSMFSVLDGQTEWKTDFIFVKSRPFSEGEFSRRITFDFQGVPMFIATAEDIVLSKLESVKNGASLWLLQDAAIVLEKRWTSLDHAYLEKWIAELGLATEWQSALQQSGIQPA
ncbi:MAG: hypothetical protein LAP21_22900 [Acidobacteriia bacterium]|nr:hypothetical protein [Terriglobia bacterium]